MVPPPDEIWVTDDGGTDGSANMVQDNYPDCKLKVNVCGLGSVASRDWMVRQATGELVLSLDDDSYPLDSDFFARLPELMQSHPEAAVVCFPELCDDGFLHADDPLYSKAHYVASYPNCAAVMRRHVYLQTAGFPPFFFHSYEEPDYVAQCAGLGYGVWFEPSLVVRHHYSPANRNWLKIHHFHARNELWSVWLRCPWPWLLLVSLFRVIRQLGYASSNGVGWLLREPIWWWSAIQGVGNCWRHRQPVSWRHYLAWMKLARSPLFNRKEWQNVFGEIKL